MPASTPSPASPRPPAPSAVELLARLHLAVDEVAEVLAHGGDRGLSGARDGQYSFDLTTDAAIAETLADLNIGILSEESGHSDGDAPLVAVVDPLDGSTNCSLGLPWYGTSICVVDADGPWVAVVADLANGIRYDAIRGGGARCNTAPLRRAAALRNQEGPTLDRAIVGISGLPPRSLGWWQFRCYGAVALDLCAVAAGSLDGYVDCSVDAHGVWDYLGALLVCSEAGVPVVDALGRDLVVLDHAARRTPVAGADQTLLDQLLANRAAALDPPQ